MGEDEEYFSKGVVYFDGPGIVVPRDTERLKRQLDKVYDLMKDGKPRTLLQLEQTTGAPQASISARLRDLRKERFGSLDVRKRYVYRGLFEYWIEGK